MRAHLASRLRSSSLSAVPPPQSSSEYSISLAKVAASILYRTPIPTRNGHAIYVLNVAALPDADEVDFDKLLPYVLARLPGEDELISGTEYEVILFAGGNPDSATSGKKSRPGWGWFIQAYHVLSRAMRKRLQKLYIVHEKSWVRVLVEMFSTIVSPKFRRKIIHVSTLSGLALHLPIEDLLIPPSAYLYDRRLTPYIHSPYASGRRAFAVKQPLPLNTHGGTRLPRVLREATRFILQEPNIQTEGIFRIPAHAKQREILKEAYDRGQKYIIWKEQQITLPVPRYSRAEGTDRILDEVDQRDAYGVSLAAGIIKFWYSELRQPIFPNGIYRDLKSQYGDRDSDLTIEKLAGLLSKDSEWSILPQISREILGRHLLPLLSIVASWQQQNKMTAENLAVCFAPALLCGPDQIEDAKMSSIIRYILTAAVEQWSDGLQEACGVDSRAFEVEIQEPSSPADWEDPLDAPRRPLESDETRQDEKHFTGIIMHDNDQAEAPPPLPPRRPSPNASEDSQTRRKPAPPLSTLPRYSTIINDDPQDMAESPITYFATTDGFAPANSASRTGAASTIDEKFGTGSSAGESLMNVPERKVLTSEQIVNAEQGLGTKLNEKPVRVDETSSIAAHRSRELGQDASSDANTSASGKSSSYHGLHGGMAALPGLANPSVLDAIRRKPVQPSASAENYDSSEAPPSYKAVDPARTNGPYAPEKSSAGAPAAASEQAPFTTQSLASASNNPSTTNQFRKPSWPASSLRKPSLPLDTASATKPTQASASPSTRSPSFNSLARPVYPTHPSPSLPSPSSLSPSIQIPPSFPKPRTPSPGLLQRMPSFEAKSLPKRDDEFLGGVGVKRAATLGSDTKGKGGGLAPRKMNIRRESVEDLRKLFEERVGLAGTLVEVGRKR